MVTSKSRNGLSEMNNQQENGRIDLLSTVSEMSLRKESGKEYPRALATYVSARFCSLLPLISL